MDLRKIKKLIELLEESGISELEVKNGEESVRIVRPPHVSGHVSGMNASTPASGVPAPGEATTSVTSAESAATAAKQSATSTLHAPMAGIFYVAPEPGAQPFVEVGSVVNVGDTLCIIESMKMMNEISAESGGCVIEILVADGEPIATGQALIRIQ